MRSLLVLLLLTSAVCAAPWDDVDPETRAWFKDAVMPDNPFVSCCGEADAYFADSFKTKDGHYVAIITDERDVPGRWPLPVGTEIEIPDYKIMSGQGNPSGHGVVWLQSGTARVYCYTPPGGV